MLEKKKESESLRCNIYKALIVIGLILEDVMILTNQELGLKTSRKSFTEGVWVSNKSVLTFTLLTWGIGKCHIFSTFHH